MAGMPPCQAHEDKGMVVKLSTQPERGGARDAHGWLDHVKENLRKRERIWGEMVHGRVAWHGRPPKSPNAQDNNKM
jgi:hypothetical protein